MVIQMQKSVPQLLEGGSKLVQPRKVKDYLPLADANYAGRVDFRAEPLVVLVDSLNKAVLRPLVLVTVDDLHDLVSRILLNLRRLEQGILSQQLSLLDLDSAHELLLLPFLEHLVGEYLIIPTGFGQVRRLLRDNRNGSRRRNTQCTTTSHVQRAMLTDSSWRG